jgi:MFS family permease
VSAEDAEKVADPRAYVSRAYAGYALAFLTLISAFNYLDRAVLGLALPLIKPELHVSDTVLGLVSGLAFALFYTLLGIPIAALADRWNRRNIIAVGFAFWSLMTALTGFVTNIWQLALARFLMGSGEACGIAPSNSLLADLFREQRRPLALAVFGTATSIASIVFFPLLGWVGQHAGWRAMFIACGAPGLLLALVFRASVREPARGALEQTPRAQDVYSIWSALGFLLGARSFWLMLLAAMFMGAVVYAGSTWNASFLVRVHHLPLSQVAGSIGPIQGIASAVGILLGGSLTDLLSRRDERWRLWLPGLACLLAAPAEVLFLLGQTRAAWMGGLALTSLFAIAHQAPLFAAAMSVARVRMRAVAIALLVLSSGLLGQIVGPLLVGVLNDHLYAALGSVSIRYSLLLVAGCAAAAGLSLWWAARALRADRLRAMA